MALKLPKLNIPSVDKVKAGRPLQALRDKIPKPKDPDSSASPLGGLRIRIPKTFKRNAERYLWLIAGFFLFVAPFALFTRFAYYIAGATGEPTIHSICYKLPLDWMITGTIPLAVGPIAVSFVVAVLAIALLFGPQFCGRLCPVGAISEFVSRIIPLPERFRMRIWNTSMTASLRYGFLAGFLMVGWVAGGNVAQCTYGVDIGRYCSSAIMEYMSLGLFSAVTPANFWNTGALLALLVWLGIGGIMMIGGRGWCLFFCPLGALSGLSHAVGKRLGLYHIEFKAHNCRKCKNCTVSCPMWAIGPRRRIEYSLCIGCRECVNNCAFDAYAGTYGRNGEKIKGAMMSMVDRVKAIGVFAFASASAPVALIVAGPCASTGCAACPLGGACMIALPLIYGGTMVAKSSSRIHPRLAALRSRLFKRRAPASGEEG
jgi:ferredoxin-type protein NapH